MICKELTGVHEECGVFGVYSHENKNLAYSVYYALYALQHRGQEAGGIAVTTNNKIEYHKGLGLIHEVFNNGKLDSLPEGDIAIGHVRYAKKEVNLPINAQPLVFTGKAGKIAIALNGCIINSEEIKKDLVKQGIMFQTTVDTEIIAALINTCDEGDFVAGVKKAVEKLKGSFAFVVMTTNKLIAVRDSFGLSPLVLGKIDDDYVVASESCGLDAVNATLLRDVEPGEILLIDSEGTTSFKMDSENEKTAACIFEHVYLARPDSIIDECSVYESRMEAGRMLAKRYPVEADMVAGVPDSALVSARGYAEESGIPYIEALNKNRYIGRTFIQPHQGMRENSVKIKMNAIKSNVNGKKIILLDDSIVRGTTSKKIVKLLKDAGAAEVHLRIASPIVKHPCYFGIDIDTYNQLIGASKSKEEIREYIGADSLEFLQIQDLVDTARTSKCNFCTGCFSGEYPMPVSKDVNKKKYNLMK